MNKQFFLLLGLVIFMSSCKDNNDHDYDYNQIIGTWIVDSINGKALPTDSIYVSYNDGNHRQTFSRIVNKVWTSTQFNVNLDNARYTVDGNGWLLSYDVSLLTNSKMIYTTTKFTINGVDQHETKTFSARKVTDSSFQSAIIGTWEGNVENMMLRWVFKTDGTYDFYSQDASTGTWQRKDENDGKYIVYGNLLIFTYNGKIETGATGYMSDCIHATVNSTNSIMNWRTTKNDIEYNIQLIRK